MIVGMVFSILLAWSAASDLMTMKIPNWISICLIVLFFPLALYAGLSVQQIGLSVLVAAAIFAGCFALFAAGVMGGGDAKLLTATALWFGYSASLVSFLVLVAFSGGILTVAILLLRYKADVLLAIGLRLPHSLVAAKKIPYGIAIAAGGILAWSEAPLFLALMHSPA